MLPNPIWSTNWDDSVDSEPGTDEDVREIDYGSDSSVESDHRSVAIQTQTHMSSILSRMENKMTPSSIRYTPYKQPGRDRYRHQERSGLSQHRNSPYSSCICAVTSCDTTHTSNYVLSTASSGYRTVQPKVGEDCCICLHSTNNTPNYFCSVTCGTVLHRDCLLLYNSKSCPVCRTETEFLRTSQSFA
jgi:hypothetical protein